MSMKDAVASVFNNYATFSGRARRSEYWYWILFNAVIGVVFGTLQGKLEPLLGIDASSVSVFDAIFSLYELSVFIPGLAVLWRRLHDAGKSGATILLGLIPLAGVIIIFVLLCKDSQPGYNNYGPNPKESRTRYPVF